MSNTAVSKNAISSAEYQEKLNEDNILSFEDISSTTYDYFTKDSTDRVFKTGEISTYYIFKRR